MTIWNYLEEGNYYAEENYPRQAKFSRSGT